MKQETIVAKAKGQEVASAVINMPENLPEAIEMFGEDRVYDMFRRQYKIAELNKIRDAATTSIKVPKAIADRICAISDPDLRRTVAAALGLTEEQLESIK